MPYSEIQKDDKFPKTNKSKKTFKQMPRKPPKDKILIHLFGIHHESPLFTSNYQEKKNLICKADKTQVLQN